ncbi:uncharacterized protein F4817DRAFT_332003 [Daldinia loculata]|uniref:uncharacterized protein n=1 Tax=Daldinia loculata TaxID=103429 RepID=UPI0020C26561|nr:uncharacterized protein F4817DRAFT_332003 [Daldinia loculata]KAI1649162.1 hypothetical protein F4817DRAFT_332003 [Daldinia loculata]
MSSVPSTGNASAQRVPAWKRLGLKLKPASEESQNATLHTGTVAPPVPNNHQENIAGPINVNAKRKSSGVPALDHSAKKPKRDASQSQIASTQTPSKKAKSVSFAAESTQQAGSAATTSSTQIRNKQKQPSPKKAVVAPVKKQAAVNLEPALLYLRQWHTSKDTWKFNKNHQTRLLEQVFADETTIPAADINVFYEYIRGLKGAVRTRLRELASGTKAQDMELGSQGFSASSKEMIERRQREYEEVIAAFLRQPRITGKRRFDEIDYVLRTSDMEMQRRVVKRMRCENVLDELSDSETETVSTTTTAEDSEGATSEGATAAAEDVQRLRLNDGPLQRVKRKRKSRTVVVDEDTSSESESGSDSDSDSSSGSSDSSSSDDESGDEAAQPQLRTGDADTSSSSSSSESESASDDSDDDSEGDN